MSTGRNVLNIGMFGCGTVGGGVFDILHNPKKIQFFESIGVKAFVSRICVRNAEKERNLKHFAPLSTKITTNHNDILEDPSINCVIELMGGITDAKDVVFRAIECDKHVITANKALVANFMPEILQLLNDHPRVRFGYEASVCGGIPIIHTLQTAYDGDNITEIAGIMNGTTNYMLSKMAREGVAYDAVLKEAQELGFAEANPSADVDGFDVQSKIAILAKLGFGGVVSPSAIPTVGISRIESVDFEYAKMMNSTIKLLGVAKRLKSDETSTKVSVFVSPVIVSNDNVIASINGATNIVNIQSDNLNTSAYVGDGAGRFPTANSVLNDIIQLARGEMSSAPFKVTQAIETVNNYAAHFYVRIRITDKLGVVKAIGSLAEASSVSIYSILQAPIVDRANVTFVVTTDEAHLSQVQQMCQKIGQLPFVKEKPLFFPIL